MITIETNKDLSRKNTLAIPAVATHYVELHNSEDAKAIFDYAEAHELPIRILGSGSNLVMSSEVAALVVFVCNLGRSILVSNKLTTTVKVQAGENWHDFVSWSIENGLNGLENLALIPGTVGAAPVQNIGAYGVEVGELIKSVDAFDSKSGSMVTLSKQECCFEYRDSIFKRDASRFLITSVTFDLSKQLIPKIEYGPLQELSSTQNLDAKMIFSKVCDVRLAKLPDPFVIPNAGSFFKNPIVSDAKKAELLLRFPSLVCFPSGEKYKLAAGWLIEQAGFKGKHNNDGVGCYSKQALVIVNPNRSGFASVMAWAEEIQKRIEEQFGIVLEIEPREWN